MAFTEEYKRRLAEKNKGISTAQIEQDILDTRRDIAQWLREADHYERSPLGSPTARLDHMRADARRGWINEGYNFIEKLEAILEVRKGV